MTYKEAHKILEDFQREMTLHRQAFSEDFINAHGKAIEALEMQIPKKVIEGKCFCEYKCACCGFVFDGTMPFCLSCGQALDWSE